MLLPMSVKLRPLSGIMRMMPINPHHEKDYRLLALFAPQFMLGAQLLVLRLSQSGRLEGDVVRGQGATTRYGTVLIHLGHMRHVQVPAAAHQELLQALEASGRLVREPPGEPLSSKPGGPPSQ